MKISGFIDEIDKNFEIELNITKELGLNFIELRSINKKNISDISLDEAITIKKMLDKKNIAVSCLASPIGKIKITDNLEEHFNKFRHIVELCEIFKVKYIRIFSFFIEKNEKNIYKDRIFQELLKYLEYIRNKDIILLHENEKNIFGDDIISCLELVEKLNSKQFRLIFDSANFVQVGVNPRNAFEKLNHYVDYYHLKDSKYFSHNNILIGEGDGEIKYILNKLVKSNFQGFVSLEPHLTNFSTLQSLELENINNRTVNFTDGEKAFKKSYHKLYEILNNL